MTIPLEVFIFPLLAFAIYFPSLRGGLIFDDHDCISRKRWNMVGVLDLRRAFYKVKDWRQFWMRELTFRELTEWSYGAAGVDWITPRAWHIGNVLIHSGTALIVVSILSRLGLTPAGSLMGGFLFLVHPLAVGAVAYISGRAAILGAALGFMAIDRMLAGHPLYSVVLLLLAAMAKEDALAFLPLVSLLGWWFSVPFWWVPLVGPLGFLLWKRKRLLNMRLAVDQNMAIGGLPGNLSHVEHVLVMLTENILHLSLWALGFGFSTYHGSGIRWNYPRFVLAKFIAGASVALFIGIPPARLPLILFWLGPWLVYVVIRVPDALMEYRNYSSILGLAMGFGLLALSLPVPAVVLILALAASLSAYRSFGWASPRAFWSIAIHTGIGEKSRAFQELGATYREEGDLKTAIRYFEEAVQMNPRLAAARYNLAWSYAQLNRFDEAIALLEDPLSNNSKSLVWYDLGQIYERAGKPDKAEETYRRGIQERPNAHILMNRLGMLLLIRGRKDEAAQWCARALELQNETAYRYNCCVIASERKSAEDLNRFTKGLPNPLTMTSEMLVRRA